MKSKMSIGHKFAYSFYDFSAYKEFLSQGLGKGIFYIFLVTLIFSTLGNVRTVSVINDDMSRLELKFKKQSPDFEYKDGKFKMDYDGPLHYSYNGDSEFLHLLINDMLINHNLIVDTNGENDVSLLDPYSRGVYISSDALTIKTDNSTIETTPFSELFNVPGVDPDSLVLNKDSVLASFPLITEIFDLCIYFGTPIANFICNLCAALFILGPMTIIISKNLNMNISYSEACTISLYSMTMPLLLESLITVSGVYIPDTQFLFYAVAIVYCLFALKYIKKSGKNNRNKSNALL